MKILFFMPFSISPPFPQTQKYTLRRLKKMKTLVRFLPAVLLFILFFLKPALAGAPPLQWQKTFGGGGTDSGSSVQQTSDDGYIIAGYTNSYGNMYYDVYLIKTEPNGNSQWQNTFGLSFYVDSGRSVQQASDGGYIIAGSTRHHNSMESDVYLVKTDSNGNSEWQRTLFRNGGNSASSVQQTSDGGFIIAGSTSSSGIVAYDVQLIKYDQNDQYQWEKIIGGSERDYGHSVQQTSDGGYIISGSTQSYGSGSTDVYLIKTDPNGNKKWQETFGGSYGDSGRSVQQTSDGGYIIAGSTASYGAGGTDVYLVKTEPNGNLQWQKTFGGTGSDSGQSVQQTSDGGYIIAGYTESYGAGGNDVYLIKTNPNGNIQWEMTFGGSYSDSGRSVQQTSDGGYIIAGDTKSYGAGGTDVYLIKLSCERTWLGDINCSGIVNFEDLKLLIAQWLQPPDILSADIFPEPGDGIVNGFDFAILARDWLQTTIP
jgi:hypothetical protein